MTLSIRYEWEQMHEGDPTIRYTFGSLRIALGDVVATRVHSIESKSVREFVRVPIYPLAEWLAFSWWRLTCESTPATANVSWFMSHRTASVGHGFVWPNLTISSDGEQIEIRCAPTRASDASPIQYLNEGSLFLSVDEFEREITELIQNTIRRLDDVGLTDTNLHALWRDLSIERGSPSTTRYRTWEARLGFDPEEGPEALIESVGDLARQVGIGAMSEVASALSGRDPSHDLTLVTELAQVQGYRASFDKLHLDREQLMPVESAPTNVWQRGYDLARQVRSQIGNDSDPVYNEWLSELLGLQAGSLTASESTSGLHWLEMAHRDRRGRSWWVTFRSVNSNGRRFAASRYLAESLLSDVQDLWLPLTDTHTYRQRLQRSFAAEFLCPVQALRDFLNRDYTDSRVDEAADYFQVSPLIVSHQIDNHGLQQTTV